MNNHSRYEKRNDISYCLGHRGIDTGFLLKHSGVDHYHNASNYSYSSAATGYANDDNDAYERRLLRP